MTSQRRPTKWFTTLRQHQALADNSQITFDLLADMSFAIRENSTVTRIIAKVWAENDTSDNPKVLDWGIVFVDADAVVAGAFPDADDEDERVDWLVRDRLFCVLGTQTRGGAGHSALDLRAQRKYRSELDQLRVIFDLDLNGTGGVFISFIFRVLMKTP